MKDVVENYPVVLSISYLRKSRFFKKDDVDSYKRINWFNDDNEIIFTMGISKYRHSLELYYDYTHSDQPMNYRIQLVATPCNYGGFRWWFICPSGGNRCTMLYLQSNGILASRETLNLSYRQRNMSKLNRSMRAVFGAPFEKIKEIRDSITYTHRNGQATRKMRKFLNSVSSIYTPEEIMKLDKELFEAYGQI